MQSFRDATPWLLPAFATALSGPALGQTSDGFAEGAARDATGALRAELSEGLEEILTGRILGPSNTAVYVVDPSSGEPLFEKNIDEPLNPASNVKFVSSAAALDILGPDYRYEMRVFGPLPERGAIRGDVYLRGSADPTLGAGDLEALATGLSELGVRRIEGDVVLGPWNARDAVGLAPVEVVVRGEDAGEPPEVEIDTGGADAPFFEIENEAETARGGRSGVRISMEERDDDADGLADERTEIRVRGRIREGGSESRTLWLHNRAGLTAHAFLGELDAAGIEFAGALRRERFSEYAEESADAGGFLPVELARHESAPLSEIVERVNKSSSNFLADRIAMTAGAKIHGGELSMENGLAAMDDWLARAGLDPDELVLDTGSGLSYETEFSARQVMDVLFAASGYGDRAPAPMTDEGVEVATAGESALARLGESARASVEPSADDIHPVWARGLDAQTESFLNSLPIAGVDGTLRTRFRRSDARGQVYAKTGTLRNIIALSGFVESRADHQLAFAIITNDHRPGHRTAVREEQARMVEVLYDYLEALRPEPGVPVAGEPTS